MPLPHAPTRRAPPTSARSEASFASDERNDRQAWRAALACMVALGVAIGIGRFAFTPVLPLMLHEDSLDLAGGGLLASLNYAGYFVGALVCASIQVRAPTMVRSGLVATAVLLIGMGVLHSFAAWGVLRTAAGVISAFVFVFASGWGFRRLAETHCPTLAGVIYCGPGIGIALTGPFANAVGRWGADAAWIGFGVVAALLVALIWPIFSDGHHDAAVAPGAAAPVAQVASPADRSDARSLVVLYGLAGFGYIITATFLPVIARHALPGSPWPDLFWPLFGLAIIAGALISARAPTHWDNRLLLAVSYALQALGVVAGVVWPNLAGFALGSLLIGMPFTAITLYAVREARRLRGNAAAGLIGYATASYGLGQIAGPLFAAPLAQRTGSFAVPLLVAAAVLALGALLFTGVWWRQRPQAAR